MVIWPLCGWAATLRAQRYVAPFQRAQCSYDNEWTPQLQHMTTGALPDAVPRGIGVSQASGQGDKPHVLHACQPRTGQRQPEKEHWVLSAAKKGVGSQHCTNCCGVKESQSASDFSFLISDTRLSLGYVRLNEIIMSWNLMTLKKSSHGTYSRICTWPGWCYGSSLIFDPLAQGSFVNVTAVRPLPNCSRSSHMHGGCF